MKTFIKLLPLVIVSACFFTGCEKDNDIDRAITGGFIASYQVAKEDILRSIPEEYINAARNNLHIAYQHTSHGTHVSKGLFGLQDYKAGDLELFGITNNNPATGKLDFRDYAMSSYAAEGEDASDLSRNETAFIQATRNYLDDTENSDINVVVWSWCSISGHDVANNYLPGMQNLIDEYGEGGTKIGTGNGQRQVPVTFVFMTGHAEANNNQGEGKPGDQSELIIAYCKDKGYFCLDYYGIDSHDMDDTYWEDSGDDGDSENYGGNFYSDWQKSHQLGEDYYENRESPGGSASYGDHNSQHITANRKAYAMWWIMARIAGWDGK